jgi:hypothetical protein
MAADKPILFVPCSAGPSVNSARWRVARDQRRAGGPTLSDPPAPPTPRSPTERGQPPGGGPASLPTAQRRAAYASGFVLLGAGGCGVFLSDNDLGTLALILSGLALLLLGITGKLPSKVSIGDNSVEWVQEFVEVSLNSAPGPEEKRETIASLVTERSEPAHTAAASAVGAYVGYEQKVLAALRRTALEGAKVDIETRRSGDIADALIQFNSKNLLVEIKYRSRGSRLSASEVGSIISRWGLVNAKVGAAGLLVIANVPLTPSADGLFARGRAIFTIWGSEEDDPELRSAILRGLGDEGHRG